MRFSTAIRSVGCGVIVSGFGRRTATFMPLKTLRPDYVKVDGAIVRKLLAATAAEAILVRLKALGVGIQQPHPIEKIAR